MAIGSSLLTGAGPAVADETDIGEWTFVHDGDEETPDTAIQLVVEHADLADEVAPLGGPTCVPSTQPRTKRARIEYSDATGLPMYTFFHDVTFQWDCKNVTAASRNVRYEIYQPQYSFAGYVQNSMTPVNRPVVTSSAQGRFGICLTNVLGDGRGYRPLCVLERQPSITWKIYANGRATVTQTP